MTKKILLTGGSGFIASHILQQLLEQHPSNPTVITTVRSQSKADPILSTYPSQVSSGKLIVSLVPDISSPTAFDPVIAQHGDGLDVVLHTASPFHFHINDPKIDLVDPAVNGTIGILNAIVKHEPARKSVKRAVITSSFAAILDEDKISDANTVFSEKSWNPVTIEDIHKSVATAYRASKTLAEKAAWEFVGDKEKLQGAGFDLVTINPPMVFGPVVHHLGEKGLGAINTSNQRLVDLLDGKWKQEIPSTGAAILWVDVRDVARAHVKAAFDDEGLLSGKRLFTTSGLYSNREILDVVRKQFDEYRDQLPEEGKEVGGELPPVGERFGFDNSETTKLLGIEWIGLEESIGDTIRSLKAHGA